MEFDSSYINTTPGKYKITCLVSTGAQFSDILFHNLFLFFFSIVFLNTLYESKTPLLRGAKAIAALLSNVMALLYWENTNFWLSSSWTSWFYASLFVRYVSLICIIFFWIVCAMQIDARCNRFVGVAHFKYGHCRSIRLFGIARIFSDSHHIADSNLCGELTSVVVGRQNRSNHLFGAHHLLHHCNGRCLPYSLVLVDRPFPTWTCHRIVDCSRTYLDN